MADRLLIDLDAVSADLTRTLADETREDLRWYLEDYLRAPFGVYEERGPRVQGSLARWGASLFSALFAVGPARDAYLRARSQGTPVELVLRSASPGLLGLPWELMTDPARPVPLALDLAGMCRSLPAAELTETLPVAGGRLRILLVISRPGGATDVGYRTVARALVERLAAVRGNVDLVVLRPPTLGALREKLAQALRAGEPFHVVHFDGHGMLPPPQQQPDGPGPYSLKEAILAFETSGGGSSPVPASRFAQVLAEHQVPVVVLNACQSGAIGRDLEATVATRLLLEGTASVVAMAYTVYAAAAAEFMTAFYERLFAGETVTSAVSAGRKRMFLADRRPSPKGPMPLADWLVPVHYLRRDVAFTQLQPAEVPVAHAADQPRGKDAAVGLAAGTLPAETQAELTPAGPFVGRDDLFRQLEIAVRRHRVIVLYGPGGTGKTELAKAFCRWWRDTGGVERPEWILWHSFQPGLASFGLGGLVADLGLKLLGPDFDRLESAEARQQQVEEALAIQPMLLTLDNFETVRSMPDPLGVSSPRDDTAGEQLLGFLGRQQTGRSTVIIASRSPEAWLGDVGRIPVGGLSPEEAIEYADTVLQPFPGAAPRRETRAFGELMEWLAGHPLSIRLTLPHLATTSPRDVLAALNGTAPMLAGEQGADTSLAASIEYSYQQLSVSARLLLPVLCLFEGVVSMSVLAAFAQLPDVPGPFAGTSGLEWHLVLEEAAIKGLLTPLDMGMYEIHPALPSYLAALWRNEQPDAYAARREAALNALALAYSALTMWLRDQISSGNAQQAYTVIARQRRTLGALLDHCLRHQLFSEAESIRNALELYWLAAGLYEEADGWTGRIRQATGNPDGTPATAVSAATDLWLSAAGAQAGRQIMLRHFDAAEATFRTILEIRQAQPSTAASQEHIATTYHNLGVLSQGRGRLAEAARWFHQSLAVRAPLDEPARMSDTYFELGRNAQLEGRAQEADDWYRKSAEAKGTEDGPSAATRSHELGMAAHRAGRLDEADDLYSQSLAISIRFNDQRAMLATYHQRGLLAQYRDQPDRAAGFYLQALAIAEKLGDQNNIATDFHQLGVLAQHREQLEEADDWFTKSLAIRNQLGDELGAATSYHHLGAVAQLRGQFDQAEEWYTKSLAIKERIGAPLSLAPTLAQLGMLAEDRGQLRLALSWTIRSIALFDQFPHPATGQMSANLARLTARAGLGELETCWQEVTGGPLPATVREFVDSHPNGPGNTRRTEGAAEPDQQDPAAVLAGFLASYDGDSSPLNVVHIGRMLANQGDAGMARAAYEHAIVSGDGEAAPMGAVALGLLLAGQGDVAGAQAAYQQAAVSGHAQWAPAAISGLAELQAGRGDVAGAQAALEQVIAIGDGAVALEAVGRRGALLFEQGDMAGARAAFEQVIASGHPDFAPRAAFSLGELLAGQGDGAGAQAAYEQAIASGHADLAPMAGFSLGNLLGKLGDLPGARAALEQVVASGHADWGPRAGVILGTQMGLLEGDAPGGRAVLAQVVASGHAACMPQAAFTLGQLRFSEGDTEDAEASYQQALDSEDPEWAPRAALALGDLRSRVGDAAGARAAFEQARAYGHADWAPLAAFGLGKLLLEQGDVAGARAAFEQAAASHNTDVAAAAAGLLPDLKPSERRLLPRLRLKKRSSADG